jgi:tetratricopeptide (TPR) repeat protein
MSLADRKYLITIIPALFASVLFFHSPACGDEGAGETKEVKAAQPSPRSETTEKSDEEITTVRASIKTDPSQVTAHVRLGYLFLKKGSLDEALLSFDNALKINPRSYEAKTGKGVVLARKGNLQEAADVLKDALLLNPNPVRTHYELGLVYEKLGDTEKAVAEFKEGIRKHEQGR